jgi:hypothetical protein
VAAYAASVQSTVAVLKVLVEQVKNLQGQVESHFGRHPVAEIILSQPGLGSILGARVALRMESGDALPASEADSLGAQVVAKLSALANRGRYGRRPSWSTRPTRGRVSADEQVAVRLGGAGGVGVRLAPSRPRRASRPGRRT